MLLRLLFAFSFLGITACSLEPSPVIEPREIIIVNQPKQFRLLKSCHTVNVTEPHCIKCNR